MILFERRLVLDPHRESAEMPLPSDKNFPHCSTSVEHSLPRRIPPPRQLNDPAIYDHAAKDPEGFWAEERSIWTGSRRGKKCWSGTPLGPSGL